MFTEKQNTYYQQIQQSITELQDVCVALKRENTRLKRKVKSLESSIELKDAELRKSHSPLAIDENHRMALKHQLSGYIHRLNELLENP